MSTQYSEREDRRQLVDIERTSSLSSYPIDMSSFLLLPHCKLNASRVPYHIKPMGYHPTTIAHYALAHWNHYISTNEEDHRSVFLLQAQWFVEHEVGIDEDAGGWPISLPHPDISTLGILSGRQVTWLSALAQGSALSVLIRAYRLTQDESLLTVARRVVATFERDILDGGVSTPVGADGIFFEEVAIYPATHRLSGFLFALLGLYDYVALTNDESISALIERSIATMHDLLDEFDVGFWTRSHLLSRQLATPCELALQSELLKALATYAGCTRCLTLASRWQAYQRTFISRFRYRMSSGCRSYGRALWSPIQQRLFSSSQASTTMRVCIPVTGFPVMGGILTVLKDVARVTKDVWQIEYLTQDAGPNPDKLTIHRFGTKRMTPWLFPLVWLYVIAGLWKLLSLLRRGAGYVVILPQDGVFTSAFSALVAKLTGIRVVCIDHSTLTWPTSHILHKERKAEVAKKRWPWALRWLVRLLLFGYWPSLSLLARLSARLVDHFLIPGVPGDDMEQVCSRLGIHPSRITRFASMIDIERHILPDATQKAEMRAQKDIAAQAIVITIICRLAPEKGLDVALESLHKVLSAISGDICSSVRIIIAGDGPLRKWVEEDICRYGLSEQCVLWGEISAQEVVRLLAISDIFLYTSVRGACFPMAVLEAMASGCAVIASNEPLANAQVLSEGRGIVVPAADVEQTSMALECLLRDTDLRDRMGKAAREYIAVHHSAEAFRRVLLRASYWSDVDKLLGTQAEPLEVNERAEREQWNHQ